MLVSDRLVLVPATPALVRADRAGNAALEVSLRCRVPADWPPELYDAAALKWTLDRLTAADCPSGDWYLHYFATRADDDTPRELVGAGGYAGAPDAQGVVEIGYSVVPSQRRRGYASDATRTLVRHAFDDPRVTMVVAQTLPDSRPSIGVLESCGFTFAGEGSEPGVVRYERSRPAAG